MMDASDQGAMEIVRTSEALEAVTRGEIDIQIATAKKYPRVLSEFREKVLEYATIDQETAESCWYTLPRGGKVIEGPSVRLAEIVAASYKNLRIGSRVVGIDERHVTCQGACHDLENNIAASVEVKRRITKKPRAGQKTGDRFDEDMIMITSNATGAIAFRNAIFKVVPAAILKATFAEIKKVAMGDERTLGERRKAVFVYFKNKGVSEDRVLAVVEKRGAEDLTLEDVATLRGLATALGEGATTVEEAFPSASNSGKLKAGRHTVGGKKKAADAVGGGAGTQSEREQPETASSEPAPPARSADAAPEEDFNHDAVVAEIASLKSEESFDRICEGAGVTGTSWRSASDGQLKAILNKLLDMKAAKD